MGIARVWIDEGGQNAAPCTAESFFAFHWHGTRLHSNGRKWEKVKKVPNGDYVVTVRVLKALGDAGNPAHWETWTSPVITIQRP